MTKKDQIEQEEEFDFQPKRLRKRYPFHEDISTLSIMDNLSILFYSIHVKSIIFPHDKYLRARPSVDAALARALAGHEIALAVDAAGRVARAQLASATRV